MIFIEEDEGDRVMVSGDKEVSGDEERDEGLNRYQLTQLNSEFA